MRSQIKELNNKIKFLENNYQNQISVIKNYFEFDGDINILLSGDKNSKEKKYLREYKNFKNIARDNEENIKKYEKNIEELKIEIKKLKSQLTLKTEQQDMIIYYLSSKTSNGKSKQNLEEINKYNFLSKQIEELSKKLKSKDKIISSLQNELEEKAKIIFALSDSKIKSKNNSKNESKYSKNSENKENKMNEFTLKQEIENLKLKEKEKLDKVKTKYDTILDKKNDELYKLQQNLDESKYFQKGAIKELIKIYTILMDFITFVEKDKKEINKNNEEIDRKILEINNKINDKSFPYLYEELKDKNKNIVNIKQMIEKNKFENAEIKNDDNYNNSLDFSLNRFNENSKDNKLVDELKEKNKLLSLNFELHINKK